MKNLLLIIIAIVLFAQNTATAEWRYWDGYRYQYWYGKQTREEKQAYKEYLKRQIYSDRKARLQDQWETQDAAKSRRPTYLEQKAHQLDVAEQASALKQREADLIAKGVIKQPSGPGGFYHEGKFFTSMSEFRKSPEFTAMLEKQVAEEVAETRKAIDKEQRIQKGYAAEWNRRYEHETIHHGKIVQNKREIDLGPPDVYEQIRRNQQLMNDSSAWRKKYGGSWLDWYNTRFNKKLTPKDLLK